MTQIIGSGGGGGGKGGGGSSRTPTTAADSLDSKSYAKVLDLISEGEIEGLKDGHKSIFFDNTPLQNSDGTYNFEDVTITTKDGTSSQKKISGFREASNTTSLGTEIVKTGEGEENTGQTRTVSTSTAHDAVRIIIRIPALEKIEDDGDIVGTSVQIKIKMQIDGGGFVNKITDTINGRTGDAYKKSYKIAIPETTNPTRLTEIRVIRTTNNSGNPKLRNQTFWDSYVTITYTNNRYANSALAAIRINAEQFSSIPQRSYLIRGIKTKIPNNCTVDSDTGRLIYDGTAWDGTFQAATWNSCPAFALYDLLISSRYGLGDHIAESQLSKFDFYAASQYSNELVSDGFGGTGQEARFSCNVAIRNRFEAFNLINSMTSVFRGMSYWSAGSLALTQDKPANSSYLFTLSNVTQEGFSYQGSSQKNRATVVVVKYFDISLRTYAYEEVKDDSEMFNGISKYGIVTKNIEAFACTSRGQANRVGRWMIYSEAQETETVTFVTSIEAGVVCRPGQVIDIADPVKSGFRRGGRIASVTNSSQIVVDGTNGVDTDLPQGDSLSYTRTLHILLTDGTVESREVSNISGSIITVQTAFSSAPNVNGLWILETTGGTPAQNIQTTQWRVVSVTEEDQGIYAINALSYNSSKYANVESGTALSFRDFSNLNEIPDAPINLRMRQILYKKGNEVRAKVIFSWDAVLGVNEYEVRVRKDNGTWAVHRQQGPDDEILNITAGTYDVKIFSLNAARVPSSTALTGTINATGKTDKPSNVTNFTYLIDSHLGLVLTWDKLVGTNENDFKDLDVVGYEIRTTNDNWGLANNDFYNHASPVTGENLIGRIASNTFNIGSIPTGTQSYWIKAFDTEDNYSTDASSVSITISAPSSPTLTGVTEGDFVRISWDAVSTVGKYSIDYYQVSISSTFATILEEVDGTRYQRLVDWTGDQTFYVRAVDIAGNAGASGSVGITNSPASGYSLEVEYDSGTNAFMSWVATNGTTPTVEYELAHSPTSVTTFDTASSPQRTRGTSYSYLIEWTGTRRFWIRAIDAQGNKGAEEYEDKAFAFPGAVPSFTATFKGLTGDALLKSELELEWGAATKGTLNIEEYEVRKGSDFSGATIIANLKGLATSIQVDWSGDETFWVAAKDIKGNIGTETSVVASVTAPGEVPTFTQEVIDNNVLLNWGNASSILPILYYNIKRGTDYASGTEIGTKQGLFTTVFETVSGTYTYWIAAIDSANNTGTPKSVTATVNEPPDYVLRQNIDSTFQSQEKTTVTSSNAFLDQGNLFVNVDTTRTYQEHFIGTGSGGSPQYPNWNSYGEDKLYGLPSATSGFYQEIFDYEATLSGTKIISTLTGTHEAGSTSITPTISTSTDNVTYTDYAGSATTDSNSSYTAFGTSFRYVKFRYDFASAGNDDLLKMTALNMRLEAKQKTDSGNGTASTSDSGGTTVNFSTPVGGGTFFVDVTSIVVTPKGTGALIAIYDFEDAPNPTSFKVLLYDTSGVRQNGNFSWTARGN